MKTLAIYSKFLALCALASCSKQSSEESALTIKVPPKGVQKDTTLVETPNAMVALATLKEADRYPVKDVLLALRTLAGQSKNDGAYASDIMDCAFNQTLRLPIRRACIISLGSIKIEYLSTLDRDRLGELPTKVWNAENKELRSSLLFLINLKPALLSLKNTDFILSHFSELSPLEQGLAIKGLQEFEEVKSLAISTDQIKRIFSYITGVNSRPYTLSYGLALFERLDPRLSERWLEEQCKDQSNTSGVYRCWRAQSSALRAGKKIPSLPSALLSPYFAGFEKSYPTLASFLKGKFR